MPPPPPRARTSSIANAAHVRAMFRAHDRRLCECMGAAMAGKQAAVPQGPCPPPQWSCESKGNVLSHGSLEGWTCTMTRWMQREAWCSGKRREERGNGKGEERRGQGEHAGEHFGRQAGSRQNSARIIMKHMGYSFVCWFLGALVLVGWLQARWLLSLPFVPVQSVCPCGVLCCSVVWPSVPLSPRPAPSPSARAAAASASAACLPFPSPSLGLAASPVAVAAMTWIKAEHEGQQTSTTQYRRASQ
jgi:hypothetical protein